MPYSKTPSISTYETKRENFVYNPLNRTGSNLNKDARLVNMMVDVLETPDGKNTKVYVKSRPGLLNAYTTATGRGRGIYYWVYNGVGYVISVSGTGVYSNGVLKQTLVTSTGEVGFTEFVNSSGIVSLVMLDGTNGYVFSDPTIAPTKISSANEAAWTAVATIAPGQKIRPTVDNTFVYTASATGGVTGAAEPTWPLVVGNTVVDGTVTWTCGLCAFPSPHIPMPVFLDATLYVAKANSEDVYNSDIDTPLLWTAGNFISSEMYPDKITALVKNNNYIQAIGSGTIEYLYDVGNVTGSPLGRHDSAIQQFGSTTPGAAVQTEKEVIVVADTNNGGHTVWTIDGFQAKEISTTAIREILRAEGATLSTAFAHCTRVAGQKLYVLSLTNVTLVYSFDSKMWSQWTSGVAGGTRFIGGHATDGPGGVPYVLDNTTGNVYGMSEDYFTDNGTGFLCSIVTPKFDWDSMNRKFMSRFSIVGDIPDSAGAGNTLQIYWSDDDYQTWSSARNLSFDYNFPMIKQLGNFRRRAFKINYSQPYRLRLEYFEVDINKGNQ